MKYIESNSSYFIWYSDTESGRRLAESITNMPIEKRQTYLHLLSKYRHKAGYDSKKGYNLINVTFHKELMYISIYFERNPKIEELRRFWI